jgi:hypothetical protein
MLANHLCYYRQAHLHTVFLLYTQNLLCTDTFVNWSFYTETPYTRSSFTRRHFTTEAVAQSCFYTQKFYTQKPLFTRGFHTPFFARHLHICCYAESFCTNAVAHRPACKHTLSTEVFTYTSFYTDFCYIHKPYTEFPLHRLFDTRKFLQTGSFIHKRFFCTEVFARRKFYTEAITRTRSLNARHATMVRMRYRFS